MNANNMNEDIKNALKSEGRQITPKTWVIDVDGLTEHTAAKLTAWSDGEDFMDNLYYDRDPDCIYSQGEFVGMFDAHTFRDDEGETVALYHGDEDGIPLLEAFLKGYKGDPDSSNYIMYRGGQGYFYYKVTLP